MRELISKKKIADIVDNAGYNYGLRTDERMSDVKIKQFLTEAIYQAINGIDREVLRNLLTDGA
jgi:hypothetical protein